MHYSIKAERCMEVTDTGRYCNIYLINKQEGEASKGDGERWTAQGDRMKENKGARGINIFFFLMRKLSDSVFSRV